MEDDEKLILLQSFERRLNEVDDRSSGEPDSDWLARKSDAADSTEISQASAIAAAMLPYKSTSKRGYLVTPVGFDHHWMKLHGLLLEMEEFVRLAKAGERSIKKHQQSNP